MKDDSADWILRRTTDYQFVDRIAHLEERQISTEAVDKNIQIELVEHREVLNNIKRQLEDISRVQQQHLPMLESISKVVSAGMVLRWIMVFTVGMLAAVGTAATTWDVVRKMLHLSE